MKRLFLLLLIFSSSVMAQTEDQNKAEAVAATTRMILDPWLTEVKLDVAANLNYQDKHFFPMMALGSGWTLKRFYRVGAGVAFSNQTEDLPAQDVIFGFSFGIRHYAPIIGQYYIDAIVGSGNNAGLIVEPKLSVLLKRFAGAKIPGLKHNVSLLANTSLRYVETTSANTKDQTAFMLGIQVAYILNN